MARLLRMRCSQAGKLSLCRPPLPNRQQHPLKPERLLPRVREYDPPPRQEPPDRSQNPQIRTSRFHSHVRRCPVPLHQQKFLRQRRQPLLGQTSHRQCRRCRCRKARLENATSQETMLANAGAAYGTGAYSTSMAGAPGRTAVQCTTSGDCGGRAFHSAIGDHRARLNT
jgi:hypothetical protein